MTVDTIAAAIAEHHPREIEHAGELAAELAAAAEARGFPLATALVYVMDSPRQILSAPGMLRWAEKYCLTPAQEIQGEEEESEEDQQQ